MKTIAFKTETGKARCKFELSENEFNVWNEDGIGFCIACGTRSDTCETSAAGYTCESCGQGAVCGLEVLAMRGYISFFENE